jgi:hypothetical protein
MKSSVFWRLVSSELDYTNEITCRRDWTEDLMDSPKPTTWVTCGVVIFHSF